MGWITDIIKEIPHSAILKERLTDIEQKYKELENENEALKMLVATLTSENRQLKDTLAKNKADAEFTEFRGVLWKKDLDGTRIHCCPKCKQALGEFPKGLPMMYVCGACTFKAPYGPKELPSIIAKLEALIGT